MWTAIARGGRIVVLTFQHHRPAPALRPLVSAAVGYRVPANPVGLHRGLPSRSLSLVIELHAPLRVSAPAGEVAAHGVVGGLHTSPALIDASRPQQGLQYALAPLSAAALLGLPVGDLADTVVELDVVFGSAAGQLVEQVAASVSWEERFRLVDAALIQRLAPRRRVPDEIAEAWRLTFSANGRLPVAAVAQHVGWSRRHLSEHFRRATGVTPKQAARIARFEAAHELLVRPGPPSLARIAAESGYADQSHLAREWRALTGCSVTTWLRDELPFVQDAPAADPPSSAA